MTADQRGHLISDRVADLTIEQQIEVLREEFFRLDRLNHSVLFRPDPELIQRGHYIAGVLKGNLERTASIRSCGSPAFAAL